MSLWCKKHSRATPDETRCPQCVIEILTARVLELELDEYICKSCGIRKDSDHPKGDF